MSNNTTENSLGLAGSLAQAFIRSPLSPLLLVAMLFMGIIGLISTPRQEDPQISVPMVDLLVASEGTPATQLAAIATEPLELMMSEIPGVDHVYSMTQRGGLMITVQFEVGEELIPSLVKLYNKLSANLDKLPPGVTQPLVKAKGIDSVPVVNLTLWSKEVDDSVLRTLANDVMQKIKTIPKTGEAFIVGGRQSQINVSVMPEKLSGFNISLDHIANTIKSANTLQMTGNSESGNHSFQVYSGWFLYSASDVGNLVVGTQHGAPIYLRDVAKISMIPPETTSMVEFYTGESYHDPEIKAHDGAQAVTIAIAKQKGSNAVPVANSILAKVESLKGTIIPSNVHVDVTRNYGETAKDKVDELLFKLVVATLAVTILVLLALGWRPALVVTIVIPVVILLTVFFAFLIDYSINRVSLFALIFSIGILVDDAIVVVENIYRRWIQQDDTDIATAVDATREVGNPTVLATFTVVAALLPMGFVREMMGPYMAPIPVLGSAAMVFSLFAAFVFTPWLAYLLRPSLDKLRKDEAKEHREQEVIGKYYRKLITPMIHRRTVGWIVLVSIILLFFGSVSLFYTQSVKTKMLPYDNKSEFDVIVDMPDGTALPITANVTRQVVEVIREIPEVTAFQSYVGTAAPFNFNGLVRHYYMRQQPWGSMITIQLLHKKERDRSSHEIALDVREKLQFLREQHGAEITVAEAPPGPPVLQAMVGEVYGNDDKARREVAANLTELFKKSTIIEDVQNYMTEPHQIWHFNIDTQKAMRSGVSIATINRNLAMAMGSVKLGDVKLGRNKEPTYIVVETPFANRSNVHSLLELPIPTNDMQKTVSLGNLGRFVKHQADEVIMHKDLRPVDYVVGDAVNNLPAPLYAINEVHSLMEKDGFTSPSGEPVQTFWFGAPDEQEFFEPVINWDGEWRVTFVTFRDMGIAFGVALILIYILVVWEFSNFKIPLVIMAPIPLTMVGIVLGHWIMGAEFTATSMIGFIALAGIIVRNSILLVDFAQLELTRGKSPIDAVLNSGIIRMRPIVITALALVGGSSVILTDPIFQGMAVSLLFGVVISTLLTLVVIPLGCLSLGRSLYPAGYEPPLEDKRD
jgi:multidrug efflux pump subunit AcrB